ncbi:MAG: M28 family peptidase [bacterium]|nr:M28 family peptidase [bacterium]
MGFVKPRLLIPTCLLLGFLSVPVPSPGEVIAPRENVKSLINSVTRSELVHHLRILSGEESFDLNGVTGTIHSRNILHPDIESAVKYLTLHLENLGLEVETYPFPVTIGGQNLIVKNLLTRIPGKTNPDRIYLLSGHYDSTASFSGGYHPQSDPAPGADDDGTAVSVLLTLAGALRQSDPDISIGFLFLTGEEYGLLGSRFQARVSARQGENILGVINMDMLGPDPEAKADTLYAIYGDHAGDSVFDPEPLARTLYDVTIAYDLPLKSEPYYGPVLLNSDHFPYWYWGYPALYLGHVSSSLQYHTTEDRIDTVDLDYLEASARIIGAAAAHLASPGSAREEKTGGCQAVPQVSAENIFILILPLLFIFFIKSLLKTKDVILSPPPAGEGSGFHGFLITREILHPRQRRGVRMTKRIYANSIAMVFLLSLVFFSCSGESKNDALIMEGKSALSRSDPTAAREAFQAVLDSHPDNPEAQFGLVLSDLTSFWNSIDLALSEIFRLYYSPSEILPNSYANEDEAISAFIQKFITDTQATFAGISGRLAELEKQKDFRFRVESLPVGSLYNQSRSLQVEFDRTDLYLLSGFSRLMAYLFEFLDAFDWEGRYGQAADLYFLPGSGYGEYFDSLNLVVFMLNDQLHPNLLGLKNPAGAETLARSGQDLAQACDDFLQLIESLQAETSGRDGNFVIMKTKNGRKYIAFGGEEISRSSDAANILDLEIELRPEIAASLEATSENLKTGAGTVSLKNNLLYLIDPMVRALALAAGLRLPAFLADIHISTLVPDVVELNLGRFYQNPAGLRQLLPPWENTGNVLLDNLVLEWECPSDLHPQTGFPVSGGLICPDPDAIVDSGHFQSLAGRGIAAIPADGINSVFPYIPFPDPTFNGLLYLDPEPLGISSLGGWNEFKPADNLALNAILASLLGPILELL